ncbi:MAG: hypothetical protein P8J55_12135 [Pseudomonadales bacterium]|jgi:hypothetical protein|nr:hypothetical protein [Pseudomonadales bacterium]
MKSVLSSDIVVATTAVVAFSLTIGFVSFYLAYLTYEDRYGVTFVDYVKLIF